MSEYVVLQTNEKEYGGLVLCLSSESLLSYIGKIEDALALDKKEERVLIDQLFVTGNGANRFLGCEFANGKMDFATARIVVPDEYYRKETIVWLHNNYSYVENSILTEEQKRKIRNKIAF
ncbi:MAG: type II toxin-antitoxin system RnlB family antitoxin [Eggerthellaceae bacterium]|nr:type II toxin-antitoxin system RnlB family antitoxin [Eggerthellaceae bacterium]